MNLRKSLNSDIKKENDNKNSFSEITSELVKFRNERDWEQFHNPKDLAIALSIEANELLELFLWKNAEEANKEKIKEELADVFAYAFLLADKYNLDVKDIIFNKIKLNAEKYPVEKSKGTAKKYNEL
jgi:NTP pyrophosphatase (non-canonical NTP hydrolase)